MPTRDPERQREHVRDYYVRHRDDVLAKADVYRNANRAALAAKQRLYYLTHRDEILARRRARKTERRNER